MMLITRTGVRTSLSWWTHVSVLGRAVILVGAGDEPESRLVLAEAASVEEAMRLLVVIEDRIGLRARKFDSRSWNGHAGVDPSLLGGGSVGERDEA